MTPVRVKHKKDDDDGRGLGALFWLLVVAVLIGVVATTLGWW